MRISKLTLAAAVVAASFCSCSQRADKSNAAAEPLAENAVIETIMSRRSVRAYLPQPVGRDTMEVIATCGINAPNAMNKQEWEIRIVDDAEFIDGLTALFVEENPKMAENAGFKNMFRNAPTVAFIAAPEGSYSGVNCGLLSENMILAAWSMGIGSCCLGGPVAFLKSEKAADYLAKLQFSEGYELALAIGFGYPAEEPDAKARDASKIKFID